MTKEKELKKYMKDEGGIIESYRGDRAYYSKKDKQYLIRFTPFKSDNPQILDQSYIKTFKKSNFISNDFKIPFNLTTIKIETRKPTKWIIIDSETNQAFDHKFNNPNKKKLKKILKRMLRSLNENN